MANHRYWRILVTKTPDSSQVAFKELKFLDSNFIRTVPQTIIAKASWLSSTWPITNTQDDDPNTYWWSQYVTDSNSSWIQADFGQTGMDLAYVTMEVASDKNPIDFSIQWSDDGLIYWTESRSYSDVNWDYYSKTFEVQDSIKSVPMLFVSC